MLQNIGFIGAGYMGHGMARNPLRAGFKVQVLVHRKRQNVDDLLAHGATEAKSLATLANWSHAIILCLPNSPTVDRVLRREDGIGQHASTDLIIIDCTTSTPETLLALARDYPDIHFVDAPLGRSPREAREGRLSVMLGGEPTVCERVRPVLSAFASDIQYAGPAGSGHALKLVNNFISMGYAALYAEALTLCAKAGIDSSAFDTLISSSRMNCEFFQTFMGWMRDGDASSHAFTLASALETLEDTLSFAKTRNYDTDLIEWITGLYRYSIENDGGDCHLPELPRWAAARQQESLQPANTFAADDAAAEHSPAAE